MISIIHVSLRFRLAKNETNLYLSVFNVLKIKFEYHNSVSVWLSVRSSILCTFLLHAFTYLARSLGFFNAFLLEKYNIKIAFKIFITGVVCTVCGAQVYLHQKESFRDELLPLKIKIILTIFF